MSLSVLLDSPAWQRSDALLLQRLQAALQHTGSLQPRQAACSSQEQTRCLLAARHSLPSDQQWPHFIVLL